MASIRQWFLIPVSKVSARNVWHNHLPFVSQIQPKSPGEYFQKNWVGVCSTLPETLTLFQTKIRDFPYSISDLIRNLISCLRPETLEPGAWLERVTSCYGTYTVVGVNIKREMVLSPNDKEVANSSKKHTQFKTRVHKPYPISDQNGRNWYPISDQNGWKAIPFGASHTHGYSIIYKGLPSRQKMRCRLWVLLLTQARRINTNVVCSLNYCMENLRGGQNSTTTKYFWDVDTLHQLFTLSFKPKIDVHVPILRRKTKFSWGWLWLGLETQQYLTCMQF